MVKVNHTAKEIGDELIIDKERYSKSADCGMLVCIVYDPQRLISNPVGFENDLSSSGPPPTTVWVVPR